MIYVNNGEIKINLKPLKQLKMKYPRYIPKHIINPNIKLKFIDWIRIMPFLNNLRLNKTKISYNITSKMIKEELKETDNLRTN